MLKSIYIEGKNNTKKFNKKLYKVKLTCYTYFSERDTTNKTLEELQMTKTKKEIEFIEQAKFIQHENGVILDQVKHVEDLTAEELAFTRYKSTTFGENTNNFYRLERNKKGELRRYSRITVLEEEKQEDVQLDMIDLCTAKFGTNLQKGKIYKKAEKLGIDRKQLQKSLSILF
jgi:hypothetical protein